MLQWHVNNNNNNNNKGNFICVFECTIVNLATYRQFTNAAWDWIIKKKKKQNKQQNKNKNNNKKQKQNQNQTKAKKKNQNCITSGYPSSYFYYKRCNMLL